jgi:hypothetical protein
MAGKVTDLTFPLPKTVAKAAKSSSRPSSSASRGDAIARQNAVTLLNNTARNYRTSSNITALLRQLCQAEGPISSALHSQVQVSNNSHLVSAYDSKTHLFSSEGTLAAQSVIASLTTLFDFTKGFSPKKGIESLKAHMLREAAITGAVAAELTLNEAYIPNEVKVVPYETLTPTSDGKDGHYYTQTVSGRNEPVNLNIPNFFVSFVQHDAGQPFPISIMDSAVKISIFFEEFIEDIRRSVRENGHSRTTVSLSTDKIIALAPDDVRKDPVKLKAFMEYFQSQVQDQLQNLSPEQALVMFDVATADILNSGLGTKVDYTPLLNIISGLYATSMKTPPSAIGLRLESGSQALGNVESLIFLKSVKALQTPVEEILSRALTLSCRLLGHDVYVNFEFDPINLRPEEELEAFRTMNQTRVLELLSYGFISDEYAAHLLRTGPRPSNAPELSGTMFTVSKSSGAEDSTSPGDTAMGRTLQPDKEIPRKAGGKSQ